MVITNGYEDIIKGYEGITGGYKGITKSYEDIIKSYKREWEGVRTIGLGWLGRVLLEGWRGGRGMIAGIVFSAWPSPHSSPHSPLP